MRLLGPFPASCLITEGVLTPRNYVANHAAVIESIRLAVDDGVGLVQIRERELGGRHLFELAVKVREVLSGLDALILVNDRADVAAAARVDGVHLRETSLTPNVVREAFGEDFVIGVSRHSVAGAESAKALGADIIFFGPVFESPGKGKPLGVGTLRQACDAVHETPVFALGGIEASNVDLAIGAGASGVAAIRAFHSGRDRRAILKSLDARPALLR